MSPFRHHLVPLRPLPQIGTNLDEMAARPSVVLAAGHIRRIKKLLLRFPGEAVDQAGTDLRILRKLDTERAQERIAILDRERTRSICDRGQLSSDR